MDMIGLISNDKKEFIVDGKILKLGKLTIFIKGKIFNLEKICNKYHIQEKVEIKIIEELYKKNNLLFINELEGNFAIIIFDFETDTLHLIKDKLGSTPIYYYKKNGVFMFSTSLKMLMKNKNFNTIISRQALSNYLGYMYIYEPFTIFEDTYKLKKGTILSYHDGVIKENNYFNLYKQYKAIKKEKNITDEELIEQLNDLFNEKITQYGDKSSQVGIFMSSGKDSTLLAKLASDYFDKKVNTYTLGFENERDESKNAKEIAKYIGSSHHSIILHDNDVLDTIKRTPLIYDEPFADPSIIPTTYMINNIKEVNDFYLAGEGNDAIFFASKMYDIYNIYPRIKLFIKKIINVINRKRVYHCFSEMAQINIIGRFNYSDRITGVKGKVFPLDKHINHRRSAVIGDLNNTVSEKYRVKTLFPIKYHNYQYYTPYYESSILLKTFSIPASKMYFNGKGKYIFDKILYRNIPKKYYNTYKKNGFGIPIVDWMKRIMLDEIKQITKKEAIELQGLFKYDELQSLIHQFEIEPDYNKAVVLWCYYIFQLWYKENLDI